MIRAFSLMDNDDHPLCVRSFVENAIEACDVRAVSIEPLKIDSIVHGDRRVIDSDVSPNRGRSA
jgi:hypothetical protein